MTNNRYNTMFNNAVGEGSGVETTGDAWAALDVAEPLCHIVEPYEDEPDECTLFPLNASEEARLTTWISAAEGSFVSVEEMC
ncbi:hypothetical protein [Haladaptatus sp. QDMS2]|uniref:DUF7511 domain-containing protein n=2 Tax=unclassified Haladaptatus TaxID=2622732 RepID=UPI0023E7FA30|nr:hypothetical protein [Haladaptatus sp. QDMS2]